MSASCPRVQAYAAGGRAISSPCLCRLGCQSAVLAQLGAWNLMSAQRISPVQAMEVHGDGGGCLNLHAWQDAQDYLAWIVESGQMEQALYQALQAFGVPWIEDRFERLEGNTIVTAGQKRISADLFVGADGARSGLRSAAGIEHQGASTGMLAWWPTST